MNKSAIACICLQGNGVVPRYHLTQTLVALPLHHAICARFAVFIVSNRSLLRFSCFFASYVVAQQRGVTAAPLRGRRRRLQVGPGGENRPILATYLYSQASAIKGGKI